MSPRPLPVTGFAHWRPGRWAAGWAALTGLAHLAGVAVQQFGYGAPGPARGIADALFVAANLGLAGVTLAAVLAAGPRPPWPRALGGALLVAAALLCARADVAELGGGAVWRFAEATPDPSAAAVAVSADWIELTGYNLALDGLEAVGGGLLGGLLWLERGRARPAGAVLLVFCVWSLLDPWIDVRNGGDFDRWATVVYDLLDAAFCAACAAWFWTAADRPARLA